MSCNLGMRDVRDARHTLLIEKCRQIDAAKLKDPDKMRWVGKMFVKVVYAARSRAPVQMLTIVC